MTGATAVGGGGLGDGGRRQEGGPGIAAAGFMPVVGSVTSASVGPSLPSSISFKGTSLSAALRLKV